ncbi:MAG: leucyl aminopeptidase family protein [Nannocystaceae bacterium]
MILSRLSTFAARTNARTVPVSPLSKPDYKAWKGRQTKSTQRWLESTYFAPEHGNVALLPAKDGTLARVVLGLGSDARLWDYAVLHASLPPGRYQLDPTLETAAANDACLAWALASYTFTRYKSAPKRAPSLVWPEGCDRAAVERAYRATAIARDLINTPASDMGPAELATAVQEVAGRHQAECSVIQGEALLKHNYPAVFAVGQASPREPRLIDLRWGDETSPKLTLVGKGVCFDSGGLDLKSAGGMKFMKKDMGGAAMMIGLAHMVMDAGLDVRLRLLIPAVENSVSGQAYRPGDVISTRQGLSVEIGNTDAEGRLVLADALAEASTEKPNLLIDAATLTGAARVALGTELPALFCNRDDLAGDILQHGEKAHDPLWRMPLFGAYKRHLESRIADLNNISAVAQGGAITAALFLQYFVGKTTPWVHVDTMGWNSTNRPGRPAGGEAFGMRALFAALQARYSV